MPSHKLAFTSPRRPPSATRSQPPLSFAPPAAPRQRNPTPIALLTQPLGDGLSLGNHLIAGFWATACAVFTMHPMDTIKTVMQRVEDASVGKVNRGLLGAVRSVVREHGPQGFYSGVVASVAAQAPAGAIKFSVYESLTQWVHGRFPKESHGVLELACGALAFLACSGVLVPGEVMKQRMQAGVYNSIREGMTEVLQTEGVRGLYTGYRATLTRDIPYTMCEFGFYAQFKRMARSVLKEEKLTPKQELLLGGVAGALTGLITTPLDVAKTKLMTQAHVAASSQYRSVADCLVRVARADGLQGIFQGASARVVWLMPFTAIYFGVHEASKRFLKTRSKARTFAPVATTSAP